MWAVEGGAEDEFPLDGNIPTALRSTITQLWLVTGDLEGPTQIDKLLRKSGDHDERV